MSAEIEALYGVPTREALEALASGVLDADVEVRRSSAIGLRALDDPAFRARAGDAVVGFETVLLRLAEEAPDEASAALIARAIRLGADAPMRTLIDGLAGPHRLRVTRQAGLVLSELDPAHASDLMIALRPFLGDPDPQMQLAAAVALAVGGDDSRARGVLLEIAPAEVSKAVRLEAIGALARLSDPATRALLLAILRDADPQVRGAACDALAQVGDARACIVLQRLGATDPDPSARARAVAAAAAIDARHR
ncbi:MAG: hypothetical protein EB084_06825 [Proteobacteria bacterium]|nr:hypothetical protein [Pseudomonadota bacterium]